MDEDIQEPLDGDTPPPEPEEADDRDPAAEAAQPGGQPDGGQQLHLPTHPAVPVVQHINIQNMQAGALTWGTTYGGMHTTVDGQADEPEEDNAPLAPRLTALGKQLEEAEKVFVEPDWYGMARRKMAGRLVFLQGRARVGRRTAALNLLADLYLDEVMLLESDHDLTDSDSWIEHRHGYLIETLVRERADALREDHLFRLSAALEARRSYLVVTLDEDVPLPAGGDRLVRCTPPDPYRVLRRHLSVLLGDDAPIDELISEPVRELLDEDHSPGAVVDVARVLAMVPRGEETLDAAVAALRGRAREEAPQLLRDCATAEDRARLLAVAVYENHDYELIEQETQRLLRHAGEALGVPEAPQQVAPAEPGQDSPTPSCVFGRSRQETLDAIRARRVKQQVEQRHQYQYRVEPVRFHSLHLGEALLEHVWREYDAARELLLRWLADAPVERSLYLVAARKAGEMAKRISGYRALEPFRRWACSDDRRLRRMAVEALTTAAEDPVLAIQVRERLKRWVRAGWQLRWTAAMVCGGGFGASRPRTALDRLGDLAAYEPVNAEDRQAEVRLAVVASVQSLFAEPTNRPRVLRALRAWIEYGTAAKRDVAFAALQSILEADLRRGRSSRPGDLLRWFHEEDQVPLLAGLLRRALDLEERYQAFRDVVLGWTRHGPSDPVNALLAVLLDEGMTGGTARLAMDLEREAAADSQTTRLLQQAQDAWLWSTIAEIDHG